MFKLVIQDDEGKTTVVPLIRDEITIGRKEGNTIRLTERNVSRRHARILRQNGEVQIEDLGSYNGIRVNNARIAERVSLRVSDQVQIGDYKLYLKAEGVEQVDDARTMPIERVDTVGTHPGPTDVIPAAVPPPTQPMPIQTPAPGTLPPAAQLIGNPNRTLVAVADTDPQGRPVASPAQVAAVLSSPVGYGKLVVLSSNFAGKEFELSRPQMIIGRTDENDIVVNHRSISRNHAKLVREPDTGRYTISDLQSSNGVRVNGQDYGKVELRRGDVVDLGHVRLRFVEAGEDFVFSRDAVITDVPDASSKKGVWIAAVAVGLLVLGGAAYMMMRNKEGGGTKDGSNNVAVADAGTQVAVAPDANGAETTIDSAAGTPMASNDVERLRTQCLEARDAKRWQDLITCGEDLKKLDPALGKQFYDTGHAETTAESVQRAFTAAITDGALKKAKQELDKINKDSVYRADAQSRYEKEEAKAKVDLVAKLKAARRNDCKNWNQLAVQLKSSHPAELVDAAKNEAPCTVVAVKENPPKENPPKEQCNAEDLTQKGTEALTSQNPSQATTLFEAAYRCKPSTDLMKRVFLMACKNKTLERAKNLYKKADANTRQSMLSLCANNGVPTSTFDDL